MAEDSKTFVQHMKQCIAECETKAQAVGLGKIENLLLKLAQKIDEGGGTGGGVNDVYTVKQIIECTEEGDELTVEGTLQEAIAAYKQGKTLRLANVARFDGNEIVMDETIHCYVDPNESYVIFYILHTSGEGINILRKKFTADGFADELGNGETVLNSLYVTGAVSFFLHSSTPGSKKYFRISVNDSGTLTATEVTA